MLFMRRKSGIARQAIDAGYLRLHRLWICNTCGFPTLTKVCTNVPLCMWSVISCCVFTWCSLILQYNEHVSKTTCINNTTFNVTSRTDLSNLCAEYTECLQLCTYGSMKMSCQLWSSKKGMQPCSCKKLW